MELLERLSSLGQRAAELVANVETEEATKTALVMPFIQALGYDVFNPSEVIPEYTADVGIKRGEKVDYAICQGGKPNILIECKPHGAKLDQYSSQLYRYFSVTDARIAILTDGVEYRFYSDLHQANKLDTDPFVSLNLLRLNRHAVGQVGKLSKSSFDLDAVLAAAEDLQYQSKLISQFKSELESPSDAFVRVLADPVYGGRFTQQTMEKFRGLVALAVRQHVSDAVEQRLRTALASASDDGRSEPGSGDTTPESDEDVVVTTAEELEGLYAVKAIVGETVDPVRVVGRDVKSYFGVLLDDNNRKPICRLWFNGGVKYLGTFDENKNETKTQVSGPNDLFRHAGAIRKSLELALAR